MKETLSERRQTENEVYFREHNEQIQKGFDQINKTAKEQGEQPYEFDGSTPLFFYCECSDENCIKRVEVSLDNYNHIHKNNRAFVIAPNHQVDDIEHVIGKEPKYWTVEKFMNPPRYTKTLHPTSIDNLNK